jgi:subtilisin family serine protease
MRQTKHVLALLALGLLVGCQQSLPPSGAGFGIDVLDGPSAAREELPAALTGGRQAPKGAYAPDQLIVQLTEDADPRIALDGFDSLGEIRFQSRYAAVALPAAMSLAEANQILGSRPGVGRITLNWTHQTQATYAEPTDLRFAEQWSHRQTEALDLWKSADPAKNVDASKVIVAVLDTGLDGSHLEFSGRVVAPQNFTSDYGGAPGNASDGQGHGTHCAGIIGAQGNNDIGVAGVAWDVKIMPVKVLSNEGKGSDFGILQGIAYALGENVVQGDQSRVRVISMSLGSAYQGRHPAYEEAFAKARAQGVTVVVAAGNDGAEVGSPATAGHVIAVSSTSATAIGRNLWEWLSGFSNRGDRIDLAAPGGGILSTLPTTMGGYGLASGTSMACPYVAGTAALVIAKHDPDHTKLNAAFHDAVSQHLFATADDLGAPGKDPLYGHGRLNVRKAVMTPFSGP